MPCHVTDNSQLCPFLCTILLKPLLTLRSISQKR